MMPIRERHRAVAGLWFVSTGKDKTVMLVSIHGKIEKRLPDPETAELREAQVVSDGRFVEWERSSAEWIATKLKVKARERKER